MRRCEKVLQASEGASRWWCPVTELGIKTPGITSWDVGAYYIYARVGEMLKSNELKQGST